jgi:hypothetical protein
MDNPRLLIHIGVPKSATTSLQFGAFPKHPDVRFLGKPFYDEKFGYEGSLATAELVGSIWQQDELEFDLELAHRRFEAGVRPRLGCDQIAVLSEEGLTHASATDRTLTARRLAALCQNVACSILITVREQKRALFSWHQWVYTRRLTALGFEDWFEWCKSYSSYYGCNNDFPLRQYRYARLVETYTELFGRERVLVLPMEMLAKEPTAFFSRLENFAGIRHFWSLPEFPPMRVENRSVGQLGIRYQRLVKGGRHLGQRMRGMRVTPSEALEDAGIHAKVMGLLANIDIPMKPMTAHTATWLDDYYRADNVHLASLANLDLARYGYEF